MGPAEAGRGGLPPGLRTRRRLEILRRGAAAEATLVEEFSEFRFRFVDNRLPET